MRVTAAGTTWVAPTMRAAWIPPDVEHEAVTLGEAALHACYVPPASVATVARHVLSPGSAATDAPPDDGADRSRQFVRAAAPSGAPPC
ncbi:hypothetical protein ACU4GD_12550 [Cupriavidus basilensis]